MNATTRREMLAGAAALGVRALAGRSARASVGSQPGPRIQLGFGLYGMKQLGVREVIQTCKRIGYDGVELCLMAGWPSEPAKLGPQDRRELRSLLADTGMAVAALMEHLCLVADERTCRTNLERLKAAAELGHALSPGQRPIIQTILGGKPDQWEEVRQEMANQLGAWGQVAAETDAVIAIKPHVGNALHTPEGALWLLEQVGNNRIKLVYDYSHYGLQGLDLAESIQKLVPKTAFIQVKDSQGDAQRPQFLLPGDGRMNYVAYLRLVRAAGYSGFVSVEVSSQIHGKKPYDPVAAATRCYRHLSAAFQDAGICRS